MSVKILALICPLTLLFFYPGWTDAFNLPKLWILVVLTFSFMVTFALEKKENLLIMEKPKRRVFLLILYISLLIAFVIPYFHGTNYIRSLWGTFGRYNGIVYYLCVVLICIFLVLRPQGRGLYMKIVSGLEKGFILLILYALIQFINLDPIPWQSSYNRVIGTVGNPNFSASALAIASIMFLNKSAERFRDRGFKNIGFLSGLLVSFLAALLSFVTGSLQGLVVLGAGVVLIFLSELEIRRVGIRKRVSILITSTAIGVFLFISFLGLGPMGERLEQYTLKLRFLYMEIGFRTMLDNPFTGYGVDSYLDAFKLLRPQELVAEYGINLLNNNAHSVPVQIGASFGVAAFVLYSALNVTILLIAIRNILFYREINSELRIISIVWILLFAQSLLSIEQIGLGVMNWILGALVAGSWFIPRGHSQREGTNKAGNIATFNWRIPLGKEIAMLTVFCLPISFFLIHREEKAIQIIKSLESSGQQSNLEVKNQSNRLSSFTLLQPEKLRILLPSLYNAGMQKEIESWITNCLEKNPNDTIALRMQGILMWSQGKRVEALSYFGRVVDLDPLNYPEWLELAKRQIDAMEITKAAVSLNKVILLSPNSEESAEARKLLNRLEK